MATEGLLTEVLITERGSNAAAVALEGAVEVQVADVTDFTDYTTDDAADPATQETTGLGVIIDILGERYTVDTVTPGADDDDVAEGAGGDFDDTAELTPGTLTLTEPLRVQVDEDDPVWLVVGTKVATDAYALVTFPQTAEVLGDGTDSGDVAQVPIPYGMRAQFPEGLYDPPVPVVVSDDLTTVLDAPGVRPTIDGSSIVNPPDPTIPTEPPASSPAVEVHGTIDSLVVEVIEEYAGTTTLDFHISTEPDFVPSAATLSGSSRSAVFVIVSLPVDDGEGNITTEPLVLDTVYYVRTVARNVVGPAAPGPVAPGVLDPSKVSEIVTARLVAGFILTGSIQVGNITINPETGITIPQSNGGTITLPADGSAATVDAHINARSLNVEKDWSLNGDGELAGDLKLRVGVPNPAVAPALSSGWPTYPIPDGAWGVMYREDTGNPWLASSSLLRTWQEWDPATGQYVGSPITLNVPTTGSEKVSITRVWRDEDTDGWWVLGRRLNQNPQDVVFVSLNPDGQSVITTHVIGTIATLGSVEVAVNPDRSNDIILVFQPDSTTTIRTKTYTLDAGAVIPGATSVVLPGTPAAGGQVAAVGLIWGAANAKRYLYLHHTAYPNELLAWEANVTGAPVWVRRATADMDTAGSSGWSRQLLGYNRLGDNHDQELLELDSGTAGKTYRHTRPNLAGDVVKAAYTWYDGNATNGTHETAASPTETLTLPQGKFPTIVGGAAPEASITDPTRTDLANQVGIYSAFGAAALTRVTYLPVGTRGTSLGDVTPIVPPAAGNPPPGTNGFAGVNADPASIESQATDASGPLIDLVGDGTARLGNLKLNSGVTTIGRMQTWVTQGASNVGNATFVAHAGGWTSIAGDHTANDGWTGIIYSSNGIWTCQEAGRYQVEFGYNWQANNAGRRILFIYKNESAPTTSNAARRFTIPVPSVSGNQLQVATARLYLNAGETVRLGMFQSGSAGSVTLGATTTEGPVIDGTNQAQYLEILRIG